MRKIWYLYLLIFITSCNNDDTISEIPSISHESIAFKKSPNNITQDSLILTINFIDGNGDLGLSNDEYNYPYHPYNAIIDENFNWVITNMIGDYFFGSLKDNKSVEKSSTTRSIAGYTY